jgi:hypothetical protein
MLKNIRERRSAMLSDMHFTFVLAAENHHTRRTQSMLTLIMVSSQRDEFLPSSFAELSQQQCLSHNQSPTKHLLRPVSEDDSSYATEQQIELSGYDELDAEESIIIPNDRWLSARKAEFYKYNVLDERLMLYLLIRTHIMTDEYFNEIFNVMLSIWNASED